MDKLIKNSMIIIFNAELVIEAFLMKLSLSTQTIGGNLLRFMPKIHSLSCKTLYSGSNTQSNKLQSKRENFDSVFPF